ncbi:hypothetical protein [Clostridium sp. 1xD42-85]|uniref:hypothetical protein n=1 Tax=Clostridium sp. 1xD42-85 TaxID=2320084 RepID=UPI0016012ACA|nr:hypothetical protein [Clostridium sp. 1xD42-85]
MKCKVCGNVVRLKVHGGYVLENPFAFNCPKCKITIQGNLTWNENIENGLIKEFKCNNAIFTEDYGNESHLLQLATEFFTDKIKKLDKSDPTMVLSPFIMEQLNFETKQRKIDFIKYITEEFEEQFTVTLRLWELYKNKNYIYLNRQLLKHYFVDPVVMGAVLNIDYPKKIMEVLYKPFKFLLTESGHIKDIITLRNMLMQAKKLHPVELIKLKKDLQELLLNSDKNIIHLLGNFNESYRLILPVILSEIYRTHNIDDIKEKQGILTTNFEMLKNYYVESFEILTSVLPIFLGLQNILNRGDRNKFNEVSQGKFKTIKSIQDYDKKVKNKGNKVKFFEDENLFDEIYDIPSILNNSLRNSIGHHSYTYIPDLQIISFKDRSKEWDLYLIEFGSLLYRTFYAAFLALEVIMFMNTKFND